MSVLRVRVFRQDARERVETRRIEEFEVERAPEMTVADVLSALTRQPVTLGGARVAPIAWESWCLDETCGVCAMRIQGRARLACHTRVADVVQKAQPLELAPLARFPLVRDLVVDRALMVDGLRRLLPPTLADNAAPWAAPWAARLAPEHAAPLREDPARAEAQLALARCTSCGACLEACPEWGPQADYVGAAALNRARFGLGAPRALGERAERVAALMTEGGLADCGKAEVCVEVCPESVPLVDSLLALGAETRRAFSRRWLRGF
jgi:succinate dehydrogenase / fumarate reductase iron-sulfur subunit